MAKLSFNQGLSSTNKNFTINKEAKARKPIIKNKISYPKYSTINSCITNPNNAAKAIAE